ncbi:MAG: hypothetical protein A3B38_00025 [Candidatus Levybacteria bacterium RIFCSPLOWO2_01_FULL_36_13]|nr:MAG: hypothetical protein A3B38_00025 [Candidatus Levybacteria bacterium RIFCSPLOWO2_01_FULL_36_13]
MRIKTYSALIISLIISGGFLFLIYSFLPLGIALVITGGMFGAASFEVDNKIIEFIFTIGAWLWPIGVIVTFVQNGLVLGFISIVLGIVSYSFAKSRNRY